MPNAFQANAFQWVAFQIGSQPISTQVLQLPVDYFMEGLPQYREKHRTFEAGRGKASEDVTLSAGPRGRINGPKPGFTTRTDKRGYD